MGLSTAPTIDWHAPGMLSIVVQGGLFTGNIVETANHAAHWRSLFPQAEIILAISVTDLLAESVADAGRLRLTRMHRDNGPLRAALRQLQSTCDKIRISDGALPFSSLKWDGHGANNINLQIAAAQCGLEAATARYVLRVRSDFTFLDRGFLAQYQEGCGFDRGAAAVFKERVLVSWLYTLNPYTVERMPFHISDWFHFGLTEDVRRLWDVPAMSFADASYHKVHRYPAHANQMERMIVPRVAVEQHIVYHCFASALPEIELASSVDWTSRDLSVDVLVDNFVICDLVAAGCVFDKYSSNLNNLAYRDHCVTREDWLHMAARSGEARRDILTEKARFRAHPERRPFPRVWPVSLLKTKQGRYSGDQIVAMGGDGVLIHGPYDTIPSGRYRATLHTTVCRGPGTVTLRVSLSEGSRVLAQRTIALPPGEEAPLEICFDLVSGIGADFELVCDVAGQPELIVTALSLEERPREDPAEIARFDAASEPMERRFGRIVPAGIRTDGQEGHLLFGPMMTLPAGSYRASFMLEDVTEPGDAQVDVAATLRGSPDPQVLAMEHVRAGTGSSATHACVFDLMDQTERIEFRVWVTAASELTAREIVLERL